MRSMALTARAARQRGSIILPAAVAILVSLVLLASADIGYVFYLKRELQKAADLSAVAAAQRIEIGAVGPTCGAPVIEAAQDVARRNLVPAGVEGETRTLRCGQWLRTAGAGVAPPAELGDPSAPEEWFFSANANVNAVWVRLDLRAPQLMPLMPISRDLMAHAVAVQDAPVAAFSVGSRLLDVHQSTLTSLLNVVGVNVANAGVVNYEGLVQATLTPGELLRELGVPVSADLDIGSLNALLAKTNVRLGSVLDAAARLVSQDGLVAANVRLLNAIQARIPAVSADTLISLGQSGQGQGIFAELVGPANGAAGAALSATVSALDVLSAAVGIATSAHAVSVPNVQLSLPALMHNVVALRASVVEAPAIAWGQPSNVAGVPGPTAYTAQVRLGLDVCIGGNCGGLVSGLLGLLGVQVKLPITIDVARAAAELTALQCSPEPVAQVTVTTSITKMCVGAIDPALRFSTRQDCSVALQDETLLSALGLLRVRDSIVLDVLGSDPQIVASDARRISPSTGTTDGWMREREVWRTQTGLAVGAGLHKLTADLVKEVGKLLTDSSSRSGLPPAESTAAATKLADYYLGVGANAMPALSTISLPKGGYDVQKLAERLQADHDRTQQECLLGLPLLCWKTSAWKSWADRTFSYTLLLIPTGTCASRMGTASDFNACIKTSLVSQLQTNVESGAPSWLSLVAKPVLDVVGTVLTAVDPLLDRLLDQVVGLDLREADVTLLSAGCYNARLVY